MNKILGFIKKYRLGFLSGFIVGTSYIPFYPWGLFFCYLPLWYWVFFKAKNTKEVFIAGWVTQFTLTLIGFHWIAYTAKAFGGFPWPVAIVVLLLFCALAHVYIPISLYLVFRLKNYFNWSLSKTIFSLVCLSFLCEWGWPGIFPWHLGYTLFWAKLPVFHLADIIGFTGLSFLVYLGQGLIFYFLFRKDISFPLTVKKIAIPAGFVGVIFLSLNIIGHFHGLKWQATDSELKILQVQANIGNLERMYAEKGKGFRDDIASKYLELTEKGLAENSDVEVIVWPEVAIPEYLNASYSNQKNNARIFDFIVRNQKFLLSGAFSKDPAIPDPDRSVFNALFLMDPKGRDLTRAYHKTHLLAFGEYLPFSEMLPVLSKLLPFVSNFGRGPGPSVLIYPKDQSKGDFVHIGAQICYEGLFPEFSTGLVKKGAEVLVNVTNDSWFGVPFEPQQHLYMTLARAVETRRPLIRSTNTGITTYVTAHGDVGDRSQSNVEWVKRQVVPFRNNPGSTFFSNVGQFLWLVILFAFLGHLLINGIYDKFRKS